MYIVKVLIEFSEIYKICWQAEQAGNLPDQRDAFYRISVPQYKNVISITCWKRHNKIF